MSNVSSEERQPWSPLAALLMILLGFAVLPVIVQILLAFVPGILGWSEARADDWLLNSPTANFLFVLGTEVATVGVLAWFIKRRKVLFTTAVALQRPVWRDIGYAAVGIIVYFALFILAFTVIDNWISLDTNKEQAIGFDQNVAGLGLLMAFVSLVILPPLAEEIIFRGFLYGTLRAHGLHVPGAIFITSLLFGSLHLLGGTDGGLLWIAFLDTFVLSIVLCYVRETTGSIWASIGVHALKNGFVFLNLFILHTV